jgi:hypothetical protein
MPPNSVTESGRGIREKGVGMQGGGAARVRRELDVSTEVLLEGPELMLKDPTSSLTGRALSGMLAAQVALQVSTPLAIIVVHLKSSFRVIILIPTLYPHYQVLHYQHYLYYQHYPHYQHYLHYHNHIPRTLTSLRFSHQKRRGLSTPHPYRSRRGKSLFYGQ